MRKNGFTIVELLITLAIIALLLAVLLPSLSQIHREGQSARCKHNLHDAAIELKHYTNLYNHLPLDYNDFIDIDPNTGSASVLHCPADKTPNVSYWMLDADHTPQTLHYYESIGEEKVMYMTDHTKSFHKTHLNALFLDGHVRSLKWE